MSVWSSQQSRFCKMPVNNLQREHSVSYNVSTSTARIWLILAAVLSSFTTVSLQIQNGVHPESGRAPCFILPAFHWLSRWWMFHYQERGIIIWGMGPASRRNLQLSRSLLLFGEGCMDIGRIEIYFFSRRSPKLLFSPFWTFLYSLAVSLANRTAQCSRSFV